MLISSITLPLICYWITAVAADYQRSHTLQLHHESPVKRVKLLPLYNLICNSRPTRSQLLDVARVYLSAYSRNQSFSDFNNDNDNENDKAVTGDSCDFSNAANISNLTGATTCAGLGTRVREAGFLSHLVDLLSSYGSYSCALVDVVVLGLVIHAVCWLLVMLSPTTLSIYALGLSLLLLDLSESLLASKDIVFIRPTV